VTAKDWGVANDGTLRRHATTDGREHGDDYRCWRGAARILPVTAYARNCAA